MFFRVERLQDKQVSLRWIKDGQKFFDISPTGLWGLCPLPSNLGWPQ